MVIVIALALLAVFSIVSLLMGTEDPRKSAEPYDNPLAWAMFDRH